MTSGQAAVEALKTLYTTKNHPLIIVETGTVRALGEEYRVGDGHSTLYIAKWIKSTGAPHQFFSLDLSTAVAHQALEAEGLLPYVTLCEGDSVDTLAKFNLPIDFAYLDSGQAPELNLREFREVHKRLRLPGMVLIDDVYCWADVNKGKLTIPEARTFGYADSIIEGRLALLTRSA